MQLNLPGVLGIAAATLALVLVGKTSVQPVQDRSAKYLLLTLLCSLLAMACSSLYFFLGLHLIWPHLSFLLTGLIACIGPALYFYIRRVTGARPVLLHWWLLHWLPALLLELLLLPYFLLGAEAKLAFIASTWGQTVFLAINVFIYIQILIYIYVSQPLLRAFRINKARVDRQTGSVDLNWMNVLCYGFVGFVMVDGILPHTGLDRPGLVYVVSMSLYLFVIVVMAYALGQGRVYPLAGGRSTVRYANSGLRSDTAEYYLLRIGRLMQEDKPWLDSELSLQILAALVKIQPHHLSQILNEVVGKNFYDFINSYRIVHAGQLLLERPDLPIIEVAVASGYNNKNSFYNSFRRFTGMTPTEFRANPVPLPAIDLTGG